MTLGIVWLRKIKASPLVEELVFISDSRLNGGNRFDSCPKILTFSRSDCAISFAGEAAFAYPMMLQVSNAIQGYSPSRDRAMRLTNLRSHVLKVLDTMISTVHSGADRDEEIPQSLDLVLGGYDWLDKKFRLWRIFYDKTSERFAYETPPTTLGGRTVVFIGDDEYRIDARQRLKSLLQARFGLAMDGDTLDMEPFEVLRDLLRKPDPRSFIGGPPQIVKVYQHMNCRMQGVYWPQRDGGKIAVMGRELQGYENSDVYILDPDTLKTARSDKGAIAKDPDDDDDADHPNSK